MNSGAGNRNLQLSDALHLLNSEDVRRMINWLAVPKPRPTRKAEMAAAICQRLAGEPLRRLWSDLDEIQQLAVREALYGSWSEFIWRRFEAKYGELPAGCGERLNNESLPMRLFLYFGERYRSWVPFVPEDLAERLREFVPPPPEAALPSHEDMPEAVSRRVYRPWEEPQPPERIPLIRRDMERAAAQDLLTVLRLTSLGRVAVSARTGRASAAGLRRIAEALDGGDFFDPAAGEAPAGQAAVGPIRAFAWPLLQAGKLAGADDAKS